MTELLPFEPLRDFFHRRQAARLRALALGVHLVIERSESVHGNFIYPRLEITATIHHQSRRVGRIDYGISPLHDRLYINDFIICAANRGQGLGLASLWCLIRQYGLPLATVHESGTSLGCKCAGCRRHRPAPRYSHRHADRGQGALGAPGSGIRAGPLGPRLLAMGRS